MTTITAEITNNDTSTLVIADAASGYRISIGAGQNVEVDLTEIEYGQIIDELESAAALVLPDGITNQITLTLSDARNPGAADLSDYDLAGNIILRAPASVPEAFETLQAAIDAAAPGDEIILGPTEIQEDITIAKNIKLGTRDGVPAIASITGPGGTGTTLLVTSPCEVVNLVIKTPADAVGVTTNHASGVVNFRTCFFEPQGTGGTCLKHTGNGITRVLADSVVRFGAAAVAFDLDGAGRLALRDTNAALLSALGSFVIARSGTLRVTNSGCNAFQFAVFDYGLRVAGAVDAELSTVDFSGSGQAGCLVEANNASLTLQGCDLRGTRLDLEVDGAVTGAGCTLNIVNTFTSRSELDLGGQFIRNADLNLDLISTGLDGDRQRVFKQELGVGFPERGNEVSIGEGDSYTRGMLVYTESAAGAFIEVTAAAVTSQASTFTFQGTAVDNAIYMASTLPTTSGPVDYLTHSGFKYTTAVAGVPGSGRIAIEYWDGSSWSEIEGMVTYDKYPHLPLADKYFELVGDFHLRQRQRANLTWAKNDPVGLGTSYYWKRLRIVDDVYTSLPQFEQFKLHGNTAAITEDGFVEFYGSCRTIQRLPVDITDVQAASDSPSNQDVYFSDKLAVGRIENSFQNGATDRIGFATYLPYEIDTSNGVRLIWSGYAEAGATPGSADTIRWVLRYDVFVEGSKVYSSTAAAPATSSTERAVTVDGVMPVTANDLVTFAAFLDIRDLVARTGPLGDPPVVAITLERVGADVADTFGGDFKLVTFGAFYSSWCLGASLSRVVNLP